MYIYYIYYIYTIYTIYTIIYISRLIMFGPSKPNTKVLSPFQSCLSQNLKSSKKGYGEYHESIYF